MLWARISVAGVALAACGRIHFDSLGDSDAIAGDATPTASCRALAPTCGPARDQSCCESALVPGGTFLRGNDAASDMTFIDTTRPATVATFRLDRYEVTVGRFRQFVDAGMGTQANPPTAGAGARTLGGVADQGGWSPMWSTYLTADTATLRTSLACNTPLATWTDAPGFDETRPINCLTWYEAMAFCIWDGGFVPTEAQWHYAASGGTEQRAYPWSSPPGSTAIGCGNAHYSSCSATGAIEVGSLSPAGDGAWAHADLAGNVWEWVLDYEGPYPAPCDDCAQLSATTNRVNRGGSNNNGTAALRAPNRSADSDITRDDDLGVRCARAP